ncbi:hypothetical protein EVAR_64250_1 [Eumeta japonica]|uniref:Uncharacterized protein n=1 Tax=Eumeta variegata TaxID=151549 RepID=A0A4C1YY91_EUMVA|nr:hypothetical protein EVAR_64250_1 [Eumeta japonica]
MVGTAMGFRSAPLEYFIPNLTSHKLEGRDKTNENKKGTFFFSLILKRRDNEQTQPEECKTNSKGREARGPGQSERR